MVLTTVLITGGVVATGSQVYLQTKKHVRKGEGLTQGYWASYADKIEAKTKPTRSAFATRAVNAETLTPFFSGSCRSWIVADQNGEKQVKKYPKIVIYEPFFAKNYARRAYDTYHPRSARPQKVKNS